MDVKYPQFTSRVSTAFKSVKYLNTEEAVQFLGIEWNTMEEKREQRNENNKEKTKKMMMNMNKKIKRSL